MMEVEMESSDGLESILDRLEALSQGQGLDMVERSTHDGTPALKVGDRAFVRVLDAATIVLQCPLDQKVLLMEISPEIYFDTDQYVGFDAVLIRLDVIEDEELALRLADAWRFKGNNGDKTE
jgi:hypothetical protein